jgi:ethanolamine utilization cobalamin adenosyltransferase
MKTITQADLRSLLLPEGRGEYTPPPGAYITPGAKEYLAERGIALLSPNGSPHREDPEAMPVEPIANRGESTYVHAETGERYRTKPEQLTHLSGNRLVSKEHPRIAFRGFIDSLEAEFLEAQALADSLGEGRCRERLGEVLGCLRNILAAEVKEKPLAPPELFGLDAEELRRQSHDVKGSFGIAHPVPDYRMGPLALRLNTLRTRVREGELLAVKVFGQGRNPAREDIILAMNRLSSALYWLFCGLVSKG